MREWMLKWKMVIITITGVIFIGGIVWWSIAAYIGGRNQPQPGRPDDMGYVPSRGEALLVITKDGTDLSHQYWVMPWQLREDLAQIMSYYRQFGMEVDEIFQEPMLELNQLLSMMDERIIMHYADTHEIQPTAMELDQRVNEIVDPNIQDESTLQQVLFQFGSVENYRNLVRTSVKRQMTQDKVKHTVIEITDEQMQEYYRLNQESLESDHNQVRARHILVTEEDLAKTILEEILSDEISFEEAAMTYSIDGTKEMGGDLDWFGKGQMVAEFEQVAFSAPIGEVVGPVPTQFGYHLIRVDDRRGIHSYEDFMQTPDAFDQARNKLVEDAFEDWLESYKASSKIDYVINDDILAVFDAYQRKIDQVDDPLDLKVEFARELEEYVLYEEEGERMVIPNAEPRLVGLYINILEESISRDQQILNDLMILDFLKDSVPEDLQAVEIEILERMMEDYENALAEATDEEERSKLQTRLYDLEDAIQLHTQRDKIQAHGITPDQAEEKKTAIQSQIQQDQRWVTDGYALLYAYNTTSERVIQRMYELFPDDVDVALHYYQNAYYDIASYVKDPETFEMYRSMIEPELTQIQLGFTRIARDPEVSFEQRVAAYESLIIMLEDWQRYDQELSYLKELKELDPDYPDIDEIIILVEEMWEAQQAATVTVPELDIAPISTPTFDFPGLPDDPGVGLPGIEMP